MRKKFAESEAFGSNETVGPAVESPRNRDSEGELGASLSALGNDDDQIMR